MDQLDKHFQDLITELAARTKQTLSQQNFVLPLGLVLRGDAEFEAVLPAQDLEDDLCYDPTVVMQRLIDKIEERPAVAMCLSFADFPNNKIIVFLENNEGSRAIYSIPVVKNPTPQLDLENIEILDDTESLYREFGP